MLTKPRPRPARSRQPHSLRQEYEEFILQRIEDFKNEMSRDRLLALADEAVQELETDAAEQLILTEVLVLEHVDRLIMRRLRLPVYKRWRDRHVKLRQAQLDPTHWGLASDTPLASLAGRLDENDQALVLGAGAVAAALFLAAQDANVLLLDDDLATIEAAEARAGTEAVAARFQALVVSLGGWFPEATPALVVMDATTMAELTEPVRVRIVDMLKECTPAGGIHCILPAEHGRDVIPLAPEALHAFYADWIVERARRSGSRARWFFATKP
ncbi:MAG: hypothetical protein EXR93_06425 [Gemmatimonadetes bacterium]|nr:hypothetical protein [Gemmatimonadota bacterium]